MARYCICVAGNLADLADWFEGLTASYPTADTTCLSGAFADQAALHGVLARIRDLNLRLISVSRLDEQGGLLPTA